MLMTLREYLDGRPLYTGMYTEYGPFYYVVIGGLFSVMGWPVTHDAVRWLTLACWLLTTGAWAWSVWLWRRSLVWCAVAFVTATVALRVVTNGPGHPQILILLLHAVMVTALSLVPTIGRRVAFFLVGVVTAGALLTKINIGVFFLAGLGLVFLSSLRPSRFVAVTVAVVSAAMPVVLMRNHIGLPAVALQCLLYSFSLAVLALWFFRYRPAAVSWNDAFWLAGGFFACFASTIAIIRLHGVSWAGLTNGVLLSPLRFSGAIKDCRPMPAAVSAAALAAGAALLVVGVRHPDALLRWKPLLAAGTVVLMVFLPRLFIGLAPGMLWMLLTPGPAGSPWESARLAQSIALAFGGFGLMMVYPVPGNDQLAVAGSLVMVAAFGTLASASFARAGTVAAALILAGAVQVARITWTDWMAPAAAQHLPHSTLIRLTPDEYDTYNSLLTELSANCGTLATLPGMNSFHIWSGLPHPNGFIISVSMVLFDAAAQQRLRSDFLASTRPCVVFNPNLMKFGDPYHQVWPTQPFIDLVKNELVPVYARRGYEIRVPPRDAPLWR
jgi:hypothetical protein